MGTTSTRLLAIPALGVTLIATGCMDERPTRPEVASNIVAHDPLRHGVFNLGLPASVPDYTGLDGATAGGTPGALMVEVDAAGGIPRMPDAFIGSVAVFGYAWADLATGRAIVAVIHPLIGRDSNQNPDGWHTHPVQLVGGTTSDFCIVSIGTSQGGISIQRDRLRLNIAAHQAGLGDRDLDVAAAFIVQPDANCPGSRLGVVVLTAVTL